MELNIFMYMILVFKENFMKSFIKVFDNLSKAIILTVFISVFLVGISIKPMYDFEDFPYFTLLKWYDYLNLLIIIVITSIIIIHKDKIQKILNYYVIAFVFITISFLFIYFVPLVPFSDMSHIYKFAIDFSNFNWGEITNSEYWSRFGGNIYLGVFWGVILLPFPKTLIMMKIINTIFLLFINVLTSKICKEYGMKYDKIIFIFLTFFIPTILYINHIYYDLPFLFFVTLGIYIYKKYKKRSYFK